MKNDERTLPETVTIREACAILGVSDKTMRRYIKKYDLTSTILPSHFTGTEHSGKYTLLLRRQEIEAIGQPRHSLVKVKEQFGKLDQLDITVQGVQNAIKTVEVAFRRQAEHNRRVNRRLLSLAILAAMAVIVAVASYRQVTVSDQARVKAERSTADLRDQVDALRVKVDALQPVKRSRSFLGLF